MQIGLFLFVSTIAVSCYLWGRRDERRAWRERLSDQFPAVLGRLDLDDERDEKGGPSC